MGMTIKKYKTDDISLKNAYAIIKTINIKGENGIATFRINKDRDSAMNNPPLDEFTINFKVNRNENPYITAYNTAKSEIIVYDIVPTTGEKYQRGVKMPLYGWDNDIEEVKNGTNN